MNKTPQFDKALAEYFSGLRLDENGGQSRKCAFSGAEVYIRPEDIEFYKKIGVPLPTLEPAERWRRLMAYQNVHNLFYVKSAYSGKEIIAAYPPDTPFKIYEHQVWFSDKWDPLDYGKAWNKDRGFFEQFAELREDVPRPNLMTDTTNVGSDFTNTSTHLKNCYLTFSSLGGENLYYFDGSQKCADCVDCDYLENSNNCYNCQLVQDSFRCFWCEQSRSCLGSYFLFDCSNCQDCFMSSNLRNKKYYFRNQPLSKEEYQEKMKEVYIGDYNKLQVYLAEFAELKQNVFYKPDHNFRSVNSYGDYIENSKDCYWSYYAYDSQNVNYSMGFVDFRDSYDLFGGANGQLCCGTTSVTAGNNYEVKFSSQADNSRNVEYSDLLRNCRDCFGCVGLANKSFCILNRQYGEEEYWKIVDEIKSSMFARGEYGEFFSPELMPIPYKLSIISSYSGFDDFDNAARYGYDVSEPPVQKNKEMENAMRASELPSDIKDAGDDILNKVIHDEKNDKYFRIVKYELEFYRRNNLPLPREHPLARLAKFRKIYGLRLKFYARNCKKCGISIESVYNPERYENVYCKECYEVEVA